MLKGRFEEISIGLLVIMVILLGYLSFGMHSIIKSIPKPLSTEEILEKLYDHDEFKSYVGTQPQALVQISANNIEQLTQQIPGLDERYIGALAIGFEDRIVLYDYGSDTVLANIPLSKQPVQSTAPAQTQAPKRVINATSSVK
jgi:hypothetical protein